MSRREKLLLLWAISATILSVALAGMVLVFALPRNPVGILLGPIANFPPDSVKDVNLPADFADPLAISQTSPRVWVVRDEAGTFTVFFARSTYHGRPVNWVPQRNRFEDPTLGSAWSRSGEYLSGPDPRDLDRFPVIQENGQLFIDSRLIKGTSHES